jgi:hypothetical protein
MANSESLVTASFKYLAEFVPEIVSQAVGPLGRWSGRGFSHRSSDIALRSELSELEGPAGTERPREGAE